MGSVWLERSKTYHTLGWGKMVTCHRVNSYPKAGDWGIEGGKLGFLIRYLAVKIAFEEGIIIELRGKRGVKYL